MTNLYKLAGLIEQERHALLHQWRRQVRALSPARCRGIPVLNDHMPGLLDELGSTLKSHARLTASSTLQDGRRPMHGLRHLQDGFGMEDVVIECNILRTCLHNLARENGISLQGRPFHVINRVFDHAISLALETYANQQALKVQQRREEYLAFVAHDLRTPLFAISLAGRTLEQSLPKRGYGEDAAQMLKSLRRGVQQLEGLVQKVLEENTHFQGEEGIRLERRTLNLWSLVDALVDDIALVSEDAGTQIVNSVPCDLTVYADAGLLRRILQNLIVNAVKYTPNGIVIIGANGLGDGNSIVCWVRDDGAGIDKGRLQKIFNKGETDTGRHDGIGLGLAIAQAFAQAHGGHLTVESELGVGSTFRFTLPGRVRTVAPALEAVCQ